MEDKKKIKFDEFDIKRCGINDIDLIVSLQNETLDNLLEKDLLRKNSLEMLIECLSEPNYTIGAWYKGELAGFSVLYFPHNDKENLSLSLEKINIDNEVVANYKLCIVKKEYIGNSLQYHLGTIIEEYAKHKNVSLLCATVSPQNKFSLNNLDRMGFKCNRTLEKYGYDRLLFYKFIK